MAASFWDGSASGRGRRKGLSLKKEGCVANREQSRRPTHSITLGLGAPESAFPQSQMSLCLSGLLPYEFKASSNPLA